MSLEDVIIHIRIEEQNRNKDDVEKAKELSSKVNVVKEKLKQKTQKKQVQKTKLQDQAQCIKQGPKPNY